MVHRQGKERRTKGPQDGNPEKMTRGPTLVEPIFFCSVGMEAAASVSVESNETLRAERHRGHGPRAGGCGAPAPPPPPCPGSAPEARGRPPAQGQPGQLLQPQLRPNPHQEHFHLRRRTEAGSPQEPEILTRKCWHRATPAAAGAGHPGFHLSWWCEAAPPLPSAPPPLPSPGHRWCAEGPFCPGEAPRCPLSLFPELMCSRGGNA